MEVKHNLGPASVLVAATQLMLAGVEVRALEIVMIAAELSLWWSIRQCDVSVPIPKTMKGVVSVDIFVQTDRQWSIVGSRGAHYTNHLGPEHVDCIS